MSFEEWFGGQLGQLLRFATVLSGSPDLAEDLVQDVALKCQLRWGSLAALEHRDAYVRRMLVNEHLSFRRKFSRVHLRDVVERGAQDDTPDFTDQHADRAALAAELDRLPRRQRTVLVLRYYEGLDDAAIAAVLGCAVSTVRAHASRALATLRVQVTPSIRPHPTQEDLRAH